MKMTVKVTLQHEYDKRTYTLKPCYFLPFYERLQGLGVKSMEFLVDDGGVTIVFADKHAVRTVRLFIDDEGILLCSDEPDEFINTVRPCLMPLILAVLMSLTPKVIVGDLFEKGGDENDT